MSRAVVVSTGGDSPKRSAARARLRHVDDGEPGYRRVRSGRGFSYRDPRGKLVRQPRLRARFDALAIPPAWREVWICRHADGHIQATGRDDAGRKQYIYHPRWRQRRDGEKYRRVAEVVGAAMPRIRAAVRRHLRQEGLGRQRVLAAVVRLLDRSFARIGNAEYTRNGSYGLTTIRKRHVRRAMGKTFLRFAGKSGSKWEVEVDDPRVIAVIDACLATPGLELFKYVDEHGTKRDVTSADVNRYLSEIAGVRVTAKDFRTWAGTVLAGTALREVERLDPSANPKRKIRSAIAIVADKLRNTPAVCRQSYVHPQILEAAKDAALVAHMTSVSADETRQGLRIEEVAVLAVIESVGPSSAGDPPSSAEAEVG